MRIESYFFAENLSKRSFCKMAKQDCIACPRLVINFETIQNILNCRKLHFRHSNRIHKNPQISSESDVQQGYTYLCISFPWDGSRLNLPCLYLPPLRFPDRKNETDKRLRVKEVKYLRLMSRESFPHKSGHAFSHKICVFCSSF